MVLSGLQGKIVKLIIDKIRSSGKEWVADIESEIDYLISDGKSNNEIGDIIAKKEHGLLYLIPEPAERRAFAYWASQRR